MRQRRNRIDFVASPSRAGDEQRHREREPEGQRRHQDREQGRAGEGAPVERLQEKLAIVGKTERVDTRSDALAERKDGDLDMRQDDEAAEPQDRRREEEQEPEAARRSHAGKIRVASGVHPATTAVPTPMPASGPACGRAARSGVPRSGASIRSDEFAPSKSTAETRPAKRFGRSGKPAGSVASAIASGRTKAGRPVAVDRAHALDDAAARQAHRRRAEGRRQHLARPLVGLADETGDEARRGVMVELARRADLLEAPGVHDRDAVRHHERLGLVMGDVDEAWC